MAETYTKKNGRLVNSRGEWVWNGESYEYVINHSDWLPLVFKSTSDADEFELLEKIWKAEQIIKNSKDPKEVQRAKQWLKAHAAKHSDMSNVVYYVNGDIDFLMHHGIKGQKWGVENGPPYPLTPSKDYSAAEKKANKIVGKVEKLSRNLSKHSEGPNVWDKEYVRRMRDINTTGEIPFGTGITTARKYSMDQAIQRDINNARNKLDKISKKYSSQEDIVKNIDSYKKELDKIVSENLTTMPMSDDLKKFMKINSYAYLQTGLLDQKLHELNPKFRDLILKESSQW